MDLDEALIFRLYLARELLLAGSESASGVLPTDRMRAILQLDHSTELLLLVLLPLVGKHPNRGDSLPSMLRELTETKPSLASHRSTIERIRRSRDRVQHDGLIPSQEDVRTAALETESFARAAVREILERELEELTLVSLVKDVEAAEHLRRAEELLRRGEYGATCEQAAIAFALASTKILAEAHPVARTRRGTEVVRGLFREIGQAARRAAATRGRNDELSRFAERFAHELSGRGFSLRHVFELLERPLLLAELGISLRELRRFDEITPEVALTYGGGVHVTQTQDLTPTKEDAAYALDFATRALLVLERWLEEHPSFRQRRGEDQG